MISVKPFSYIDNKTPSETCYKWPSEQQKPKGTLYLPRSKRLVVCPGSRPVPPAGTARWGRCSVSPSPATPSPSVSVSIFYFMISFSSPPPSHASIRVSAHLSTCLAQPQLIDCHKMMPLHPNAIYKPDSGKLLWTMASRQSGRRNQASDGGKHKPQGRIVYTGVSVTKDGWSFTVKQGATIIHEDNGNGSSHTYSLLDYLNKGHAARPSMQSFSQVQWACYRK